MPKYQPVPTYQQAGSQERRLTLRRCADASAGVLRRVVSFAGELLTSPAVLLADIFQRERTLTRRTLIAYLVLLALVSAAGVVSVVDYRSKVEAAWTVLDSYAGAARGLPAMAFGDEIRLAAAEQDLDPALVAAVCIAESSLRADAISRAGARGLMQLMPATWRLMRPDSPCDGEHAAPACGADCIFTPLANLRAGTAYLRSLLVEFEGNFVAAFAAYNAGPAAVRKVSSLALPIPPFAETEHYVRNVLAWWADLRADDGVTAPVQQPHALRTSGFAAMGSSLVLWTLFMAWALIKGRRTGHPDSLV